jgi:hypothetical protein
MFSGDAYTSSKKQQFYFRRKPLSSIIGTAMGTKMAPSYANIGDRGGSIKEGHFGFRHFVCKFYRRMDTVGMFEKFIKLFIAMYPLHVNGIYKKINKRVPLVLTYHPSLEKISGIVRHHWKEIEKVKRWLSCSLNHPL